MKKKLLFLLEAFDKGGIEKVTLDIVNHLDPDKYEITVQTFWYGGYCQSQVHDNIKVKPFFFKRYVRGIIRLIGWLPPKLLYRLFVHGDYDVEIAASDGGAAKVISGSGNKKAKKVCWVHMDVVNRGSQLKEFQDARSAFPIYSKFDLIACVSRACQDKFEEKFGAQYPIAVKYNPLPADEITEKAERFVPDYPKGFLHFVCVGRLVEQKGFDRLLPVCQRLKAEGFAFTVDIIGDGPLRTELEAWAQRNGLQETVWFRGFQDNPYPYIKNADAFLLASRDEAFPLVIGESMLLGTPSVATDCCGVDEWLRDSRYGLIMENSEEGIYKGMRRILEDPSLLREYKKRIPERVRSMDFETVLRDFEAIWEK